MHCSPTKEYACKPQMHHVNKNEEDINCPTVTCETKLKGEIKSCNQAAYVSENYYGLYRL